MKIIDLLPETNSIHQKWYGTSSDFSDHHRSHMIVLHKFKAVYFFIPKVACSSIKMELGRAMGLIAARKYTDDELHRVGYPTTQRWKLKKYRHYFKFTFVRNPWDRLVSCYSNKIKPTPEINNENFKDGVFREFDRYGVFRAGMTFENFAEAVCSIEDGDAQDHFRSQHTFLYDGDQPLIDFVGRFENLAGDFALVQKKIGLPGTMLEQRMSSNRKSYRDYYNPKTRQLVEKRFARDIDLFKYDF